MVILVEFISRYTGVSGTLSELDKNFRYKVKIFKLINFDREKICLLF
jgi:hypothetical protein